MHTVTLEEAQDHLAEIIDGLSPGEEVVVTRDAKPIAKIVNEAKGKPFPLAGRCKGMIQVISEDDEHLKDFAEYMP